MGLHCGVAAQGFNLQLGVVQSLLDHVTDADHANHLAVIDDGKMAGPFLSHDGHDLGYGVMARAAANIPGHQITDFLRQDIRSAAGKRPYDVALGYDAVDRVIAVHHQKGANPALGQDVHGFGDRSIGGDGYDVGSLALNDSCYMHSNRSPLWAVPGTPPFRRSMISPRRRCPASREKAKHRPPPGTVKPKDNINLRICST